MALLYLGFATTDRGDLTLGHAYQQESWAISQRYNDFAGTARPDCPCDELSSMEYLVCWYHSSARAYWQEGMVRCEQLALPFEKAWLLDCIGNDARVGRHVIR